MRSCDAIYNLPVGRNKRATSFGVGVRFKQLGRESSPPPNTYKMQSAFDERRKKGEVYTFGVAREAYTKVYLKSNPPKDAAIPGPGTYNVIGKPGHNANKYTFRPRTTSIII